MLLLEIRLALLLRELKLGMLIRLRLSLFIPIMKLKRVFGLFTVTLVKLRIMGMLWILLLEMLGILLIGIMLRELPVLPRMNDPVILLMNDPVILLIVRICLEFFCSDLYTFTYAFTLSGSAVGETPATASSRPPTDLE